MGNNNPLLDYALSNKLYFAANLKIPILVSPNTYMEKISTEYGFGYSVDINAPDIGDRIYNWYNSIDWDLLEDGCKRFIDKVESDNSYSEKKIIEMLRSW